MSPGGSGDSSSPEGLSDLVILSSVASSPRVPPTTLRPSACLAIPSMVALRLIRCLTSETRSLLLTRTPSFSGCPSRSPISLIRTFPSAISSSPSTIACKRLGQYCYVRKDSRKEKSTTRRRHCCKDTYQWHTIHLCCLKLVR